jgi:hypothetical protein
MTPFLVLEILLLSQSISHCYLYLCLCPQQQRDIEYQKAHTHC